MSLNRDSNKKQPKAEVGPSWTIDHAITIFQESDDPIILDSLDVFIKSQASLLKQPLPFISDSKPDELLKSLQLDITLRSVKYTITEQNKKDAVKIANLLQLDAKEVLRIISQVSQKVPENTPVPKSTNILGELHNDDLSDIYESERIQFYCGAVLRERRSYLRFISMLLQNRNNQYVSSTIQQMGAELSANLEFVSSSINGFKTLIQDTLSQKYLISNGDDDINKLIGTETLLLIIDLLKVLINLFVNSIIEKTLVLQWFEFMAKTNFLAGIVPTASPEFLATIGALATVASLLLIDLDNNFGDLSDDITFMNDPKILRQITDLFLNSPTNPLIIYAWSFILHRKSLLMEAYPSNPVVLQIVELFDNNIDNLKFYYTAFASKADEIGVCEAIIQCYEILKFDSVYTSILGSYIISMLPYVDLTPKIASVIETVLSDAPEHIVKKFFADENSERLIILSRAKLPVSLASYVKLCNINGVFAYEEFSLLKSYMETFKELDLFNKYEFDEYNPELVQFNENIDVFPPYEKPGELSLLLEKGIKGKLIPTDLENEQVVIFLYEYNGLSLIGRVLQNLSRSYDVNDQDKCDLTVDILNMITRILQQCPRAVHEDTILVMSAFVDSEDIFKVIFEILDRSLAERNIKFLIPLMQLLNGLLEGFSEKVWAYIKRSSLIENGSKGGDVSNILGAIETVHGKYDFTLSVIELCRGLMANCLNIHNKTDNSVREELLGKFMLHLVQIYESFTHWKYVELHQKLKIGTLIGDIFSKTLTSAYGIGENSNVREKPTKVFAQAAEHIIKSFLAPTMKEVRSNKPILLMLETIPMASLSYQTSDAAGVWYDNWVRSAFELATLLTTARSILGLKPSRFEESLFAQSKNLVEIYANYVPLRKCVMKLFTSLVSAKWPNEPPSLLAHLGNHHSIMLMKAISVDLENTFEDYQMKICLYDFFSAVMDGNFQEGLSIMFITGRDVRDFVHSSDKKTKTQSILSILKKQITQIYEYPETVGLHLVEAISLAFNSWTTAKEDGADKEFISVLINKIKSSPRPLASDLNNSEELVSKSYEFKLISKIAEILALYLFVLKSDECVNLMESLITDEEFLKSVGTYFNIHGYQPLLHSDLHKSFETKWPSFKLLQFLKSTLVKTRRYGVGSVYNISLMDELFKQEEEWESYREHITSVSINLSYIEAQITAAKCFGALLTSYCSKTSKPLGPQFLKLVGTLLELEDSENSSSAPIFNDIHKERIELAFFITYKTTAKSVDDDILYPILNGCSKALSSNDLDLISGFVDGDTVQYRPLLRTVLVAVKMINPSSNLLSTHPEVFVNLFSLIVSKGLGYLFSSIQSEALSLHDKQMQESSTIQKKMADVVLILSILKSSVKLPLTGELKHLFAESLVDHSLIRSILNLYSCSHIIKVSGEAVFAELTLIFIQELISIKEIAEKFLKNGLFSVLVESPVSTLIQKGGIRANVSPNYHHIWTNGLLSILMTLLSVFGEKIMSESVMFVTYFSKQIQTNLNNWFQDSIVITNATIQETGQIVLLYKVLQALNIDEYLLTYNVNNFTRPEDEEISFIPGLDTAEERQGLVNVFNYLLSHPKFLSLRVAPITPEENRLFEQDNQKFVDEIILEIKDLKTALSE